MSIILLYFYLFSTYASDQVFFQSEQLKPKVFKSLDSTSEIKSDDGSTIEVTGFKDEKGLLFWYRRLDTPVCLTGTCKLIDIGIYWTCAGEFFGLEVYGEPLTKTDHSDFKKEDYDRLIRILQDDWSALREYNFSDLTVGPEVDGVSGATRDELAGEAIEQAVYTTYTIWHLVHLGEEVQLIDLTAQQLRNDPELLNTLITSGQSRYHNLLMDLLVSEKIQPSKQLDSLLVQGMSSESQSFRDYAFRSLVFSDRNRPDLQSEIAGIYKNASLIEKLKILNAFKGAKISEDFQNVLIEDLKIDNQWFLDHLHEVLKMDHP